MWRFAVRAVGVSVVAIGSLNLLPAPRPRSPTRSTWRQSIYRNRPATDGICRSPLRLNESTRCPTWPARLPRDEGFVTLSATATAEGGESPITDSLFITGYQLGCQTDVSSGLGVGGAGAGGGNAGIDAPLSNPVGASDNVGGAGGGAGFVQTTIQPGVIVEVPMMNMALSPDGRAMLDLDNIHIKADACGGDVTVRSYAYLRVATALTHTGFAVYGDPLKI